MGKSTGRTQARGRARGVERKPGERVVTYARVSSDKQAEKWGLDVQARDMRAAVKERGYQLVQDFVDDGFSGEIMERRPALRQLRQLVKSKGADVVLMKAPDRLARKASYAGVLIQELSRHVRVEFLTVETDGSAESNLFLHMLNGIAEFEKAKILERTSDGLYERASAGKHMNYRYGHKRTPDGELVLDEERAPVVRLMFQRLLKDKRSVVAIMHELRASYAHLAPARTGRWNDTTIRQMLLNPAYGGRAVWNRTQTLHGEDYEIVGLRQRPEEEWLSADVPAIVPMDWITAAQRQLSRNRSALGGRPSSNVYLLRGLLVCGECGWRYNATNGGPKPKDKRYRCSGRYDASHATGCRQPSYHREKAEQKVWETVMKVVADPSLLDKQLEEAETSAGVREIEVESAVVVLQAQRDDLDKQERNLLAALRHLDNEESPAMIDALKDVRQQRKALAERLAAAEGRAQDARLSQEQLKDRAAACAQLLKAAGKVSTPEEKRELLSALVPQVDVKDGRFQIHLVIPQEARTRSVRGAKGSVKPFTVTSHSEELHSAGRTYLLTVPVGAP